MSLLYIKILLVFIPASFLSVSPEVLNYQKAILSYVVIAYASYNISSSRFNGYCHLTFWLFVYIFMGLIPFYQNYNEVYPLPGYYSLNDVYLSTILIVIGLVSYNIGSFVQSNYYQTRLSKLASNSELDPYKLIAFSFISTCVCILLISNFYTISDFFNSRFNFSDILFIKIGKDHAKFNLIMTFIRVPTFISSFLFLFILLESNKVIIKKWILILFFSVYFLLTLFINNPIITPRYWIGTIFLSFLFLLIRRKPWIQSLLPLTLLLLVLFVFPFLDLFRNISPTEVFSSSIHVSSYHHEFLHDLDFDSYQQLLNCIEFVSNNGLTYGKQLLGVIFFWVPRSLWSGKPWSTGNLIGLEFQYQNTNLSLPLWGELYINGGFLFVIVGFYLLGRWNQMLDGTHYNLQDYSVNLGRVYSMVFGAYQIFLLRGSLLSSVAYLCPILLFFFVCSKVRKESRLDL